MGVPSAPSSTSQPYILYTDSLEAGQTVTQGGVVLGTQFTQYTMPTVVTNPSERKLSARLKQRIQEEDGPHNFTNADIANTYGASNIVWDNYDDSRHEDQVFQTGTFKNIGKEETNPDFNDYGGRNDPPINSINPITEWNVPRASSTKWMDRM